MAVRAGTDRAHRCALHEEVTHGVEIAWLPDRTGNDGVKGVDRGFDRGGLVLCGGRRDGHGHGRQRGKKRVFHDCPQLK